VRRAALLVLLALAGGVGGRARASECVSATVTYHTTGEPFDTVWFYWTPPDGYAKAGETGYCTDCDIMETFTVTTPGGFVLGHKLVGPAFRTGYWCND
jgi:hypothetical protein